MTPLSRMIGLSGLRSSISLAKRSLRPIRNAALDYIRTSHPGIRGQRGHVHAKFTKSGNWQRYYIPLLACFHRSGFSISVWPSASFLQSPSSEDFGFFRIPWLRVSHASESEDILLTDNAEIASRERANHDRIGFLVEEHHRPALASNETRLPVLMHPKMYLSAEWEGGPQREKHGHLRDIRLAFAGNLDPTYYDSRELGSRYKVATRAAIARSLLASHGESCLYIRTWEEKSLLSSSRQPIVIVDSYKAGLDHDEYFEFLARSDFFLAMPGLEMPNCHNLAEALSVGCIPVLEGPEWRAPLPLVPGLNCVTFDSLATLSAAVNFALTASAQDISSMRRRVRNIWQEFLEPERFVARIMEGLARSRGDIAILLIQPDG